jgi:hypothetical protein
MKSPHLAKTLSFLLPGRRAAAPPSESSKTLLSLFQRCSHRALFSLRRNSARSAARFIPTSARSLRCAQNSLRYRLRVNRAPILWLGARRKGIARTLRSTLTVLPPPRESAYRFTRGNLLVALIARNRAVEKDRARRFHSSRDEMPANRTAQDGRLGRPPIQPEGIPNF